MPSRSFIRVRWVAISVAVGMLVMGPTIRATSLRACVLSVKVDPENDADRQKLRQALEQELDRNAAWTRVAFTKAIQVAVKKQLAPEEMTIASNLYDLAIVLDLDIALMAWSTPYGKKKRLVVAAIDPLDGSALAKGSIKMSTATPSKAALRKLMHTLLKDLKARKAEDEAEAPPPPPVR